MAPDQGGPAELFQQTGQALAQIAAMSKGKVPPEVADSFAQIAEQYAQTVDAMLQGGGGDGDMAEDKREAAGAQPVSQEAGASGNAVPMR